MPADDAPVLPDWPLVHSLALPTPEATDAVATTLANRLAPGDVLLLSGQLGSGKSHFARALIRRRFDQPNLAVPSPTFTLIQTYDAPGAIELWHADLYRLADPGELVELGLDEPRSDAISLIEWPDRLAPDWPNAVLLHLDVTGAESRLLHVYAAPNFERTHALFDGVVH